MSSAVYLRLNQLKPGQDGASAQYALNAEVSRLLQMHFGGAVTSNLRSEADIFEFVISGRSQEDVARVLKGSSNLAIQGFADTLGTPPAL